MNIKIIEVCKTIKNKKILEDVNLEFFSGKIYGFVGSNGAGKTMLFRAISGLMKIDSGKIMVDDKELYKDFQVLPNLGITIENAGLYPELTGFDNLMMLSKINKKIGRDEISDSITRVGLDPNDKRKFRKYSMGMKQRIVLAQAIMEHPEILILDEPTNGLDENGIELIRNIILEEKNRGTIILISSHNKEDIEVLCDDVYIVDNGKITKRGD